MSEPDDTTAPRPRRRLLRGLLYGLLAAWVAVVGAATLVVLAVLNGWQPERLRSGLETAAPWLIGHEVRIGRLEGGLRDGLALHDVAVRTLGEDAEDDGVLRALRIAVRLDGRASLRRRAIVLAELTVVNARVTLSRVDDRGWRLDGWGPLGDPDGSGRPTVLPIPVLVGTLALNDTELRLPLDVTSGLEKIAGRLDAGANGIRLVDTGRIEWPVEARVRLRVDRAGWRGVDFGRGALEARLEGPALRIERLELDGPVGLLTTTGSLDFAGPLNRPRARHGDLRTHVSEVDVNALARRGDAAAAADADDENWTALTGDAEIALRDRALADGEDGFALAIDAVLAPSVVLGGPIRGATLSGGYRTGEQRWSLDEGTIELEAGTLAAAGSGTALAAESITLDAEDLDLALLPRAWLRSDEVQGRAALHATLEGPLADPAGRLTLSARALVIEGLGPSTLELAAESLGERRYRLDALRWHFAPSAGRLADTHLRATAPATFDLSDGAIVVRDLALDWTGGALAVDGGLRDGALLPTRIEVEALDLDALGRVLALTDRPGGRVSGRLEVAGSPTRPDVRGELDWRRPRYRGLEADHIAVAIDGDATSRRVDARMTRDGGEPLQLAARLPRPIDGGDPRRWLADPAARLELRAQAFDLAWLEPVLAERGLVPAGAIDGRVTARGDAEGPIVDGALDVAGARLDDARTVVPDGDAPPTALVGPLTGRFVFDGRSARTEALRYGEGADALDLDTRLAWSGPGAEDLDLDATVTGIGFSGRATVALALRDDTWLPSVVTFDDFSVAELARRARLRARLDGALTGEVVVRGPTAEPDFRTRLVWRSPEVQKVRAEALEIRARSVEDRIELAGHLTRDGRRVLEADGRLPLDRRAPLADWTAQLARWSTDPDARLALSADGFPLDWLAVLAPGLPLRTDGLVTGRLEVAGADPVIGLDGALTLERGVFSLATQTASVGPLDGRIEFEGRRARFDRLVVAASRGRAVLTGHFDWSESGVESVSVRTDFDRYRFDQLGLFQASLDGSVLAAGPLDALRVDGTVALGEIRIAFPSQADPVLKEIRVLGLPDDRGRTSIVEGEGEIAGVEAQSTVDVTLTLPRGTWVRGMGLDAEIVGEIEVTKAPGEPLRYLGRMQVEHGRYTLQGKRFDLDSGVAVFTGGPSPIPDIDVQAHRSASRDVEVYAQLSGPADAPRLELTSDPPMDAAEIISYLYFGRSATVGNRESRGVGSAAAGVAGSMLVDSVAPELRETLRIDEISVTSGEDGEAPAVEIETQVTPDVYLRLIQSFGAAADEAVEVRWRFWKGLSLQSMVSRSGASAIDLLWEFDYWGLDRYGLDGFTSPPPPYRAEPKRPEEPCRPPLACPSG